MITDVTFTIGMPYQIHTTDMHFVGYLRTNNANVKTFRVGLDDMVIVLTSEITKAVPLSPRDIETRKTSGRYFIY
jgi:uracil phosphoribosyltransferase